MLLFGTFRSDLDTTCWRDVHSYNFALPSSNSEYISYMFDMLYHIFCSCCLLIWEALSNHIITCIIMTIKDPITVDTDYQWSPHEAKAGLWCCYSLTYIKKQARSARTAATICHPRLLHGIFRDQSLWMFHGIFSGKIHFKSFKASWVQGSEVFCFLVF